MRTVLWMQRRLQAPILLVPLLVDATSEGILLELGNSIEPPVLEGGGNMHRNEIVFKGTMEWSTRWRDLMWPGFL